MDGCCDPAGATGCSVTGSPAGRPAVPQARAGRDRARMVDPRARGVEGATVLEIGGGVGEIQLELLRAAPPAATNLELVAAYDARRRALLRRPASSGRVEPPLHDIAADPAAVSRPTSSCCTGSSAATPITSGCSARPPTTRGACSCSATRRATWRPGGRRRPERLLPADRPRLPHVRPPAQAMLAVLEARGRAARSRTAVCRGRSPGSNGRRARDLTWSDRSGYSSSSNRVEEIAMTRRRVSNPLALAVLGCLSERPDAPVRDLHDAAHPRQGAEHQAQLRLAVLGRRVAAEARADRSRGRRSARAAGPSGPCTRSPRPAARSSRTGSPSCSRPRCASSPRWRPGSR